MTIFEVLTLRKPWNEIKDPSVIEENVMQGKRPEIPLAQEEFRSLITKCWAQKASDRPTFKDIIHSLHK